MDAVGLCDVVLLGPALGLMETGLPQHFLDEIEGFEALSSDV